MDGGGGLLLAASDRVVALSRRNQAVLPECLKGVGGTAVLDDSSVYHLVDVYAGNVDDLASRCYSDELAPARALHQELGDRDSDEKCKIEQLTTFISD